MVHNAGQSIIVSLMRLIHITDPHLSTLDGLGFMKTRGKRRSGYLSWFKNRRFVHRREVLDRLVGAIEQERPDWVLVTGDLVHIGLEREMEEAARWLRELGPPGKVILVPGNHDNYAGDSLQSMYRHWAEYLPDRNGAEHDYTAGYPFIYRTGPLRITGINSSCVTRIFSAQGELGAAQRERLSDALQQADGNTINCLLVHHPPLPGITGKRKALRDADALETIIRQQQPQLVLYGHIHRNREDRLGESRIYCTASASSVDDASYRVFDLHPAESGWYCRTRLVTLKNQEFTQLQEDSWQILACASPSSTGQ